MGDSSEVPLSAIAGFLAPLELSWCAMLSRGWLHASLEPRLWDAEAARRELEHGGAADPATSRDAVLNAMGVVRCVSCGLRTPLPLRARVGSFADQLGSFDIDESFQRPTGFGSAASVCCCCGAMQAASTSPALARAGPAPPPVGARDVWIALQGARDARFADYGQQRRRGRRNRRRKGAASRSDRRHRDT
jgi:hypothetical protein